MIVTACIISLVYYCLFVLVGGGKITPDGTFYSGIRNAPNPYRSRMLPYVLHSSGAWRFVHCLSFCVAAMSAFVIGGWPVMLLLLALPIVRQSMQWPILLDMPMMAISFASAAFYSCGCEYVALALIALSVLVHERTPILTASTLICLGSDWLPVAVALASVLLWYAAIYRRTPKAYTGIAWLDTPMSTAIQHHRATLTDAVVWLAPWGAALLSSCAWSPPLTLHAVLCYGGCAVAMDRVRIYQAAPLPFIMAALSVIPAAFIPVAIIATFIVHTREV